MQTVFVGYTHYVDHIHDRRSRLSYLQLLPGFLRLRFTSFWALAAAEIILTLLLFLEPPSERAFLWSASRGSPTVRPLSERALFRAARSLTRLGLDFFSQANSAW